MNRINPLLGTGTLLLFILYLFFTHPAYGLTSPNDSSNKNPEKSDSLKSDLTHNINALEKTVVTGLRKQRLLDHAQSYTVIKASEWIGTTKSLADVLAEQTGVQTRRYGATGSFQTVSIRGIQGNKVLILLDGIPLNSASGDVVDLGNINPHRIAEIEIYKGIVPSRYGGSSIGGVINLKSKTTTNNGPIDLFSALGAFGHLKQSVSAFHAPKEKVNLFAGANFLASENDFPYLDRNNTPYNPSDDQIKAIHNHQIKAFDIQFHPKFPILTKHILSSGITYSSSRRNQHAREGRLNQTARYDEQNVHALCRLQNAKDVQTVFSIEPEISLNFRNGLTYWTNQDSSFGHSHGSLIGKENAYGKLGFQDWQLYGAIVGELLLSNNLIINTTISANHNDFKPTTTVTGFPQGDWKSEQQTGIISAQANGKFGSFGATLGGGFKLIRGETDGGFDQFLNRTIPSGDTITTAWSFFGGVHWRPSEASLLFFNGARYNKPPTLRERYGAKGGLLPNPNLIDETGYLFEVGTKINGASLYCEMVGFNTINKDAIIMISDGYMSKPANLGGAHIYGLEANLWYSLFKRVQYELQGTLQRATNEASMNNWQGNMLPGEPALSMTNKLTFGPFSGFSLTYWLDFHSYFYRDPGNTPGNRVPHDGFGVSFHNALIKWNFPKKCDISFSIRNMADFILHYEEMGQSRNAGYSWILFPGREWCFSVAYYL